MASKNYYRQCSLSKPTVRGQKTQVSWLPERFAVIGKVLKLKDGENWDNGWEVTGVGDTRQEESVLIDRSQDYKRTRKASDI
jgi:hypothetical protein